MHILAVLGGGDSIVATVASVLDVVDVGSPLDATSCCTLSQARTLAPNPVMTL